MNNHVCDGTCDELIGRGKFEGEPRYVMDVLWPLVMEGFADTSTGADPAVDWLVGGPWGCDALDSQDVFGVALWEDGSGFVHHRTFASEGAYRRALAEAERDDEEEAGSYMR